MIFHITEIVVFVCYELVPPPFKGDKMINWIKRFFVTEAKTKAPKCELCGLGAKLYMLIEFQSINLDEIDNKILIKICDGCYDEVYERYNPERKPPAIQAGVFETQMGTRKD